MASDCEGSGVKLRGKYVVGGVDWYAHSEDCPGCDHSACPARSQGGVSEDEYLRASKLVDDITGKITRLNKIGVALDTLKAEYERGLAQGQQDRAAAVTEAVRVEREACLAELKRRIESFDNLATEKHVEGKAGYAEDLGAKSLSLYRFKGWLEKRARGQQQQEGS